MTKPRTEERVPLSEYLSNRQRKGKACWHNDLDPAVMAQVDANIEGHQWVAIGEWLLAETGRKYSPEIIARHARRCVE